jgi:hypothetical protein
MLAATPPRRMSSGDQLVGEPSWERHQMVGGDGTGNSDAHDVELLGRSATPS